MDINVKQISSLEKIRPSDSLTQKSIINAIVFGGERFSYQLGIMCNSQWVRVIVESPLKEFIKIYSVENVIMDFPIYSPAVAHSDDDYIAKDAGLMPDLLIPLSDKNNELKLTDGIAKALWIRVDIPDSFPNGKYDITIKIQSIDNPDEFTDNTMTLEVMDINLPGQELIFTQWLHADCIADVHKTEVYSEEHWRLIEEYIKTASELGINMILTPVFTPPLDTGVGLYRTCVQLVDIKKIQNKYIFNFEKLHRWINICKRNNIKYFEVSHLFSQWGTQYTPNIMVDIDGEKKYYFSWGVEASSEEYINFLKQFIPSLIDVFKKEEISDNVYFHLSDEPSEENAQAYELAYKIVKPLTGNMKTFDALSHYSFYEKGLVECPVTATSHIDEFLKHDIPEQWAYYCCAQIDRVGNRLLSMPSYRNRILGIQLYKYDIKGFLQWGFNFYNSQFSKYKINPYTTTSADMAFPSGDPFTVYPGRDGALLSLRGLVFYEAIQDIAVCKLLEKYIGKSQVIKIIESEAECEITFNDYPRNTEFLIKLRSRLAQEIRKYTKANN